MLCRVNGWLPTLLREDTSFLSGAPKKIEFGGPVGTFIISYGIFAVFSSIFRPDNSSIVAKKTPEPSFMINS
jgi:hypothetical protein